jgi:RNA polymerase sigma factor FliA
LQMELGRLPREEEVAEAIGIPLGEFYDWVAEINMLNLLSLDVGSAGTDEKTGSWSENLPDPNSVDPLGEAERREKIDWVSGALRGLGENEQRTLYLYYLEGLTFKEIGTALRLSESRVCQLHHMAIFRLQGMIEEREPIHGRIHDNRHPAGRRLSDGIPADRKR